MASSCKVGTFSTGTGAINSTQDITCGFQPKAIIFCYSGLVDVVDAVKFNNAKYGWGMVSNGSSLERVAQVTTEDNGAAASAGSGGYRDDCCIVSLITGSTTFDGMIDIDVVANWPSDGFRLIVDDVFPLDMRVSFIAFGGDDITNVDMVRATTPASTGTYDILNGSFSPDIVFILQHTNADPPVGSTERDDIVFGIARATTEQGVVEASSDLGSATTDTGAYCLDIEVAASGSITNPLLLDTRDAFDSMRPTGVRLNRLEGTTQVRQTTLQIKGGSWKSVAIATQTDTTTTIPATGLAGTPRGVMVFSASRTESTQDTGTAPTKVTWGAGTGTGERTCMAICNGSGDANVRCVMAVEHDEIYANITDPAADGADGSNGALDGLMDIDAVLSDGFRFIMDNADPSSFFAVAIMFGDSPAAVPYQPWLQRGPVLAQ